MKKILIVDDSVLIVNILKTRLEYIGYSIDTATDGKEAIEKIRDYDPEIIILDLMLPKVSGLEVIKKIVSKELNTRRIPIIAMSSNDSNGYKLKSLSLGADSFVKKPFDLYEIESKIKEHIF